MRKTDQTAGQGIFIGQTTANNNLRIMQHANNDITFHTTTSDTQRMTILSAGNVGIGTTSPSNELTVKSTASNNVVFNIERSNEVKTLFDVVEDADEDAYVRVKDKNDAIGVQLHSSGYSFFTGGNVGIGTTNPKSNLQITETMIFGSTGADSFWAYNTYYDGSWKRTTADNDAGLIYINSDGDWIYHTQSDANTGVDSAVTLAERMKITNAGRVGINTSGPNSLLEITGGTGVNALYSAGTLHFTQTGGGAGVGYLCYDGVGRITGSGSCGSSRNIKKDIKDLSLTGLETISQLRPVEYELDKYQILYDRKEGTKHYEKFGGFIAEEIELVSNLFVTYNQSGVVDGVNYDSVTATLVKAVQEQQTQINELKAEIELLKSK